MKLLLQALVIIWLFARGLCDCTTDPFCTSCVGDGSPCAQCTDNADEAARFQILQPEGTCYANDSTNYQQGVYSGSMYMCADGCNNCGVGGVCNSCESVAYGSTSYQQFVVTLDSQTYCTHDCGLFPGMYSGTTSCQSCPANCFNCLSTGVCADCSYNIPRFNGLSNRFDTSFAAGATGAAGALYCDSSVSRSSTTLYLTYYLTPDTVSCGRTCTGDFSEPFGDINDILYNLVSDTGANIYNYKEIQLKILLLKGLVNSEHYWVYDSTLPIHVYRPFNRVSAQVTIAAAIYSGTGTCNDPAICYTMGSDGKLTEKPLVMWKNPYLQFYVTRNLTIQNIIFDGADIVMKKGGFGAGAAANLHPNSIATKARFCLDQSTVTSTTTTISVVPNPDYPQDQMCQTSTTFAAMNSVPFSLELQTETYGGSLFVMSFLSDYASASIPLLVITVGLSPLADSLITFISMDLWASKVTINETTFRNFLFLDGIITNTNNIFTKTFVNNHNIHDDRQVYTCLRFNSNFGDCHAINIVNSVFDSYNAWSFSFFYSIASKPPLPAKGVEAFIIRVRSLEGPILIKGSTFKNMVTLKRDSQKENTATSGTKICKSSLVPSSLSAKVSAENVARLIRKANGLFKQLKVPTSSKNLPLSISSCFDIRNLQKGLTMYQNKFEKIFALTGAALHLYGFENTLNYPIIFDSNVITYMQVHDYGTAFYIAKTKPDYSQLGCDGVLILNNTIADNVGCPFTVGTGLVLCDTDPLDVQYLINSTTSNAPVFDDSFYYHFFRNQKGDYHPFTQKLSRDFFSTLKNSQRISQYFLSALLNLSIVTQVAILHPYRLGYAFVSNGVTVKNNTFLRNSAWLSSGIIVQGPYQVTVDSNVFMNGSVFSVDLLSSPGWMNSPIVSIVGMTLTPSLYTTTAGAHTSQSPLWIKMADQVSITNNVFDNNVAVAYGDYWLGAAITLQRLIGMHDPVIQNCIFQNYIGGWNTSTVVSDTSINSTPLLQHLFTQNTVPLITVNFYDALYEFNYTLDSSSTSEYHEEPIANATLLIDSCTFQNNQFNQTGWYSSLYWESFRLYANHSFIVKGFHINETVEYSGWTASSTSNWETAISTYYNREGSPLEKITLNINNSKFINNSVYSPQPLFANTIFDTFILNNSLFENNTILTTDDATLMQSNTAFFVARNDTPYHLDKPSQQAYFVNLVFNNNTGPIFASNYSSITEQDAQNSLYYFENIQVSEHISKYPLFYFESTVRFETSAISLANITTKTAAFFIKNMSDLSFGGVVIDGIDNVESKLDLSNDSSANLEAFGAHSLCLALDTTTNFNVTNFTCLRTKFEASAVYKGITIATCGAFVSTVSSFITDFTCSDAVYDSQTDDLTPQSLILISQIESRENAMTIQNLTLSNNQASYGILSLQGYVVFSTGNLLSGNSFATIAISANNRSEFFIESSTFENNHGSLFESVEGNTTILSTTFTNNSGESGTIALISFGTIEITNCTFTANTATLDSLFLLQDADVDVDNSTFQDNWVSSVMMNLEMSTSTITNSFFLRNKANHSTPNIQAFQGELSLNNNQFVGVSDWLISDSYWFTLVAEFLIGSSSVVTIDGLDASFTRAPSGAIYFDQSSIAQYITNSVFTNGYGTTSGAITSLSPLHVTNCNFSNNSGTLHASGIYSETGTSLEVENVIVQDSYGFGIFAAETTSVTIKDSTFEGTYGKGRQGGVQVASGINVLLSGLTIKGTWGYQGGGIKLVGELTEAPTVLIDNVLISGCGAQFGGAIYNGNVTNVVITNTLLDNNTAVLSGGSGGFGGALYYDSNSIDSVFTLGTNLTISNNYAQGAGGALYYNSQTYSISSAVVFDNNTAAYYGDKEASYPTRVEVASVSNEVLLEFLEQIDPYSSYTTNLKAFMNLGRLLDSDTNGKQQYSITSGERVFPPIVFGIYDENNQLVETDNSSTLKATISSEAVFNGTPPEFMENSTFTAFKGYFILYPLTIAYAPDQDFDLVFQSSSIADKLKMIKRSGFQTSLSPITLNFHSKSCPTGDRLGENYQCISCPVGYYTTKSNSFDDCENCPVDSAICEGGSVVGPLPEFWRYGSAWGSFYECRNSEACLGHTLTDPALLTTAYCKENLNATFCLTGWCSEKYEGNLCMGCRDGYARGSVQKGTCNVCTKNWWLYSSAVVFCLGIVFAVMLVVKSAILDEDSYIAKKKKELEERAKKASSAPSKASRHSVKYGRRSRNGSKDDFLGSSELRTMLIPSHKSETARIKVELAVSPSDKNQTTYSIAQELQQKMGSNSMDDSLSIPVINVHSVDPIPKLSLIHEDPESGFTSSIKRADEDDLNSNYASGNVTPNIAESSSKSKDIKHLIPDASRSLSFSQNPLLQAPYGIRSLDNTMTELKLRSDMNDLLNASADPHKETRKRRKSFQFDPASGDEIEISNIHDTESEKDAQDESYSRDNYREQPAKPKAKERNPSIILEKDGQDKTASQTKVQIAESQNPANGEEEPWISIGDKKYSREEILNHYSKRIDVVPIFLKIMINFIQMTAIVGAFDFDWPSELQSVFNLNISINLSFIDVLSIDCLFKGSSLTANGAMPTIFVKVFLYSFAPIFLSALGALFWFLMYWFRGRKNIARKAQMLERTKSRIIVTIIVICFFMHSSLMQISISSLKCLNLGTTDAPEKFMDQDLNVPCWGTIHKRWVLIITLPSLIFWGIFVPVFALVKLMRNRDKLRTYKLKSRYGWLYEGLNEKNCYWEFFITYRKIVLILLSVFLVDLGTLMAASAVVGVLIVSFFFHAFQRPYRAAILNRLEGYSLFANTLVAYAALFFLTPILSTSVRLFFFAMLIIGIGCFLLYWAYQFVCEQSRVLLRYACVERHFGGCLRKIAKYADINGEHSRDSSSMGSTGKISAQSSELTSPHLKLMSKKFSPQASSSSQLLQPTSSQDLSKLIDVTQSKEAINEPPSPDLIATSTPQTIKRSRFYNPKDIGKSLDSLKTYTNKISQPLETPKIVASLDELKNPEKNVKRSDSVLRGDKATKSVLSTLKEVVYSEDTARTPKLGREGTLRGEGEGVLEFNKDIEIEFEKEEAEQAKEKKDDNQNLEKTASEHSFREMLHSNPMLPSQFNAGCTLFNVLPTQFNVLGSTLVMNASTKIEAKEEITDRGVQKVTTLGEAEAEEEQELELEKPEKQVTQEKQEEQQEQKEK